MHTRIGVLHIMFIKTNKGQLIQKPNTIVQIQSDSQNKIQISL